MALFKDFDINTASTPAPWGVREEQMVRDLIQTVVEDTIGGVKRTTGHRHGKVYNSLGAVVIDAITDDTEITLDNDVEITGDLSVLGAFGFTSLTVNYLTVNNDADINNLDVTTNIDTDTMTATGTVGVNDLNVTTNIDAATAILGDLDVTTNIDTATMTATGTVDVNDLNVTTNIDTATMTATGTVTINDLNVTTNIDADTINTGSLDVTGTADINNLDVQTNIDTATLVVTNTGDFEDTLIGDLFDLDSNLAIQTRQTSDKTIKFYPIDKGGYDFHLDSSTLDFRIHDGTAEFFRIHIPSFDVEATFDIPVNFNDDVSFNAGAGFTGTVTINDLDVTTNIDTATIVSTGTATLNDLDVTTNIDTATLSTSGTATLYNVDITTDLDVGGNADVVGELTADLYNLYGDLAIQTRAENYNTNFYPSTGGGYDFNVNTVSLYTFRVHDGSTELMTIDGTGVGIGIVSHDGTLHVHTSTAGSVSPSGSADDLIVESGANAGISIFSPDANYSSVFFGSPSHSAGGAISWKYDDSNMLISTTTNSSIVFRYNDSVEAMRIDGNGNVGINDSTPDTNLSIIHTANNIATIDTTECKNLGLSINATGTSNTTGHIYSGINFADGYAGIYGFDGGSSSATGLGFFVGNNTSVFEAMRIDDSGLIGIGISPSGGQLHINSGTYDSVLYLESSDDNAKITLKDSSSTQYIVTQNNLLSLGSNSSYAGFDENLNIDGNGNVGIGTTSLSNQFTVQNPLNSGTTIAQFMTNQSSVSNHIARIDLRGTFGAGSAGGAIYFTDSTYPSYIKGIRDGSLTKSKLYFGTNNGGGGSVTDRMVIDGNGSVGIGTTSPDGKLHVHTASAGAVTASVYADDLVIENNSDCGISILSPDANSSIIYFGSLSDNNAAELSWNYNNLLFTFKTDKTGGEISFRTGIGVEAMRLDSDGNVGIGIATPARKLDVNSRWPILLGSDYNSDGDRTDSVAKLAISSSVHYTNAEENVIIYNCYNDSSSNNINIGGGDGNFNACTKIRLVTAANNTTVGGTNRVVIDENGYVYMYYLQSSAGDADMRYNTSTGELTYDTSALKYKENIRNTPDTSWIYNIPVKLYDRIDGKRKNEIGIIADDLKEIAPAYCCYNKDGDIESYNKSDLVPVLLAEIQKHENRIKHLETRLLQRG